MTGVRRSVAFVCAMAIGLAVWSDVGRSRSIVWRNADCSQVVQGNPLAEHRPVRGGRTKAAVGV